MLPWFRASFALAGLHLDATSSSHLLSLSYCGFFNKKHNSIIRLLALGGFQKTACVKFLTRLLGPDCEELAVMMVEEAMGEELEVFPKILNLGSEGYEKVHGQREMKRHLRQKDSNILERRLGILAFLKYYCFILCAWVLSLHVCLCTACISGGLRNQKRVQNFTVSHHVYAGN